MTAADLADLLAECEDPEAAEALLEAYQAHGQEESTRTIHWSPKADPWDEWDAQHAGNLLAMALAEVDSYALEHGLLPTQQAQERCETLMEAVDASEGDMPAWRAAVAALKEAMLEGLMVKDTPQHTRARRLEAALNRAWWRRFDGQHGHDASALRAEVAGA